MKHNKDFDAIIRADRMQEYPETWAGYYEWIDKTTRWKHIYWRLWVIGAVITTIGWFTPPPFNLIFTVTAVGFYLVSIGYMMKCIFTKIKD